MGTVTVGALHNHIICLVRVLRILDQRLILVSDIAGEDDLFLYTVLIDPDFNGRRSQEVSHIRKTDLQPVTDR